MNKKKSKICCIFFMFTMLISVSSLFSVMMLPESSTELKMDDLEKDINELKPFSSASEVTIVTPENKTYYGGDDGYYPATYGFEDDADGTVPESWTFNDPTAGTCDVIDEWDGHKKVLQLVDDSSSGMGSIAHNFTENQIKGEIEFYMQKPDIAQDDAAFSFELRDETNQVGPWFLIDNFNDGLMFYYDSGGSLVYFGGNSYQDDTWFHFKIYFNCTTNTFDLYVNDIQYVDDGEFRYDIPSAHSINIRSVFTSRMATFYIDAVGYSWDPDYNIGDNLDEGLLLSYENSTNLEWQGYSLDDTANKTINGNITIPLPSDGEHTIQIFANDSSGKIYHSGMNSFSMRHITLNSPKIKTYYGPDDGYYPGTYGFENDVIGSNPKDFDVGDDPSDILVKGEEDGHYNVLEMYGTTTSIIANQSFNGQESGTVEMWFKTNDGTKGSRVYLMDETHTQSVWMQFNNNAFDVWDSATQTTGVISASANTWYHLRIDFNCSDDTWSFILDGTEEYSGTMANSPNSVNEIRILLWEAGGYYSYYDAIGYSWDPNYNIGDNLNEGLLLSYKNFTNLDWQGYSLDGAGNRTINGNTTIPMPSFDTHSIQVFGNNTAGDHYESEIRDFTINAIKISTPENKTYYEPDSGYYPGTYGFENDGENSFPQGWKWGDWGYTEHSGCTVQKKNLIDGHYNVIELYDNGAWPNVAAIYQNFTKKTQGTIELWMRRTTASTCDFSMELYNQSNTSDFGVKLASRIRFADNGGNDIFATQTGGDMDSGENWIEDTWYHVRVEFNCVSDTYNFSLNNQFIGTYDFYYPVDYITSLRLTTTTAGTGLRGYTDAIGYSWDPNYQIGDNLDEGILLSYENQTNLVWQGYSLDGQDNVTISGNTTIPMPSEGLHNIQIFGNNTENTIYESDLKHFSVKCIDHSLKITNPENKTYTEADNGYYLATYGFECDSDGESPTGWSVNETSGTANIINEIGEHNKVIEVYDTSNLGPGVNIGQSFPSQTSGTVEYWWRGDDPTDQFYIRLWDGSNGLHFDVYNDLFQAYDGDWQSTGVTALADTWYHIRIDFNCSSDSYEVYINGVNVGTYNFHSAASEINKIFFATSNAHLNYKNYIDAVGFSWDQDYNIGDNLNEGLLLSYENNTILDWVGYSLDGADNKTINGNTTIRFLEHGSHSIQLFANDSQGRIASDIQYFNIEKIDFTGYHPLMSGNTPPFTISEYGIYIDITCSIPGYLYATRHEQHEQSRLLGSELTSHYYYNFTLFTVYNSELNENDTILQSATVRLYYEDNQIENEDDLTVLHLVHKGDGVWVWEELDVTINKDQNYIEFTTNEFSSFCLAELKTTIVAEDAGFWVFFIDNLFMIVILAAVGVSVPAAYAIRSKRKKKKKDYTEELGFDEKKVQKLKSKAQSKREHMMEYKDPSDRQVKPKKAPRDVSKARKQVSHKAKKVKNKVKFEASTSVKPKMMTAQEKQELKNTEAELGIQEKIDICTVHKGIIKGVNYVCPECRGKYCLKCASTLKSQGEDCWICHTPIELEGESSEPKAIQKEKSTEKIVKNSKDIITNDTILGKLEDSNGLETLAQLGEITTISDEFWEKIEKIDMDGEEKETFIREMLQLTSEERLEALDHILDMLQKDEDL